MYTLNKIVDTVKYWYWDHVPYDWRPGQIWYRLKCFCWNRYTTVKPRYLSHEWHDRVNVLPHMMFEILSQFLEKECGDKCNVDWYCEECPRKILVNGEEVWVMDEMKELYRWWHDYYNKQYELEQSIIHQEIEDYVEEHYDGNYLDVFSSDCRKECNDLYKKLHLLNDRVEDELIERMIRLVKVKDYMWTQATLRGKK